MPEDYRVDRTAFKRQTAEEADGQLSYWLSRPAGERLRAAVRLNAIAWNYPPVFFSKGGNEAPVADLTSFRQATIA